MTKHGKSKTRLYRIYLDMKQRCYNENNKFFKDYGARGIKIDKEWLDSFVNFYEWSVINGYQENLTIDRIDNDKNYSPSNCRYTTSKEQARNRRNNIYYYFNDRKQCLAEICQTLNANYQRVKQRIKKGWSLDEALNKPCRFQGSR